MANPIDKLKKLKGRSWSELRARADRSLRTLIKLALAENFRLIPNLLSSSTENSFPVPRSTKIRSGRNSSKLLKIRSFRHFATANEQFRLSENLATGAVMNVIEKAEKINEGKFDLLGYLNLDFGASFDWHYEPVSGKHIPLKHWKQFDELDVEETGDKKDHLGTQPASAFLHAWCRLLGLEG